MKTMVQLVQEAKKLALGIHGTPAKLSETMFAFWKGETIATKSGNSPSAEYVQTMDDYSFELGKVKDEASLENFLKMLFTPFKVDTDEEAVRDYVTNGNALYVDLDGSDSELWDTTGYLSEQFMMKLIGQAEISA